MTSKETDLLARSNKERIQGLEFRVGESEKDIKDIQSNQSKFVWIVLTAVILAVLGLVLKTQL